MTSKRKKIKVVKPKAREAWAVYRRSNVARMYGLYDLAVFTHRGKARGLACSEIGEYVVRVRIVPITSKKRKRK